MPQEQSAKTTMLSVVNPAKGVFMHSYFETLGKHTAQQNKGHKKYWSHTAQIKEALLYVIIKSLRLCNKLTTTFK